MYIPPKRSYTIYAFVLGIGSEFYRLKSILRSCTSKNRATLICDVNHNGLRIYEVAFNFLLYFYKNLQFRIGSKVYCKSRVAGISTPNFSTGNSLTMNFPIPTISGDEEWF